MFSKDPIEQFREQVWIAPFYEDDIRLLADTIGVDKLLFGSDYPHAEGLEIPTAFLHDLHGFAKDEIRMIMRENAFAFLGQNDRK